MFPSPLFHGPRAGQGILETDADHTFYYKLEGRCNRFYERELELVEDER